MNNCKTCLYRLFDPLWGEYRCRLSQADIDDVDTVVCDKYKMGNPANYVPPKKPQPGPPSYKLITENGNYKSSKDGIIGYYEIDVQVPTSVQTHDPYKGKYEVTPKSLPQTLPTKNKVMTDHLKVLAIPYSETTNTKNGITVTIGD